MSVYSGGMSIEYFSWLLSLNAQEFQENHKEQPFENFHVQKGRVDRKSFHLFF